jgi:hypothetical protein
MKMLFTMGESLLLEELIVHLKMGGPQANLQQLHDGLRLQDRPFCQCVIVVELILMTCRASSTGVVVTRLTKSKLTRVYRD